MTGQGSSGSSFLLTGFVWFFTVSRGASLVQRVSGHAQ
jgi:hypothetical protein